MYPVVFGYSWLQKHNPLINWATGSILGWIPFFHVHCLKSAQPDPGRLPAGLGEASDLPAIPAEYTDLDEVVNKACC